MTPQSVTPDLARATWAKLEPVHTLVYFAPEAASNYAQVGLESQAMGYFAPRCAALGPVGAETVGAVFYVFNPELIRSAVPKVWSLASPQAVLHARQEVADQALRRALGEEMVRSAAVSEAAELARNAALEAGRHVHGRPLFAGHAGLEWPEEPHLVLWHAATLLREFRGDGHVSALLQAGLSPVEALVTHAANTPGYSTSWLRKSRGWSLEEWDAAVGRLRRRGLVDVGADGTLVCAEEGRALRRDLESRTDALALPAFEQLGPEGNARLAELAAPLAEVLGAEASPPAAEQ